MTPPITQERVICADPSPSDAAQRKLAVLIDADNAQPSITPALLAEIAKFGVACVRRVYGDWTQQNLSGWKKLLHAHSLLPVQQFQYTTGKNSTDCALIIDAMDLMHTGRFDGFCLVSSDSDFTRLASRLREEGLVVYGFGEEQKTPPAFVSACTRFIYTELLRPEALRPTVPTPKAVPSAPAVKTTTATQARISKKPNTPPLPAVPPENDKAKEKQKPEAAELIARAVEATSDDSGWVTLGRVASYIMQQQPEFDSRMYGHAKFSGLVRALPSWFEVKERPTPRGGKTLHVRNKAAD